MKDDYFLYQHKELEEGTKGHRVTIKDLEELRQNAIDYDRDAAYIIEYDGKRWFMIEERCFEALKDTYYEFDDTTENI